MFIYVAANAPSGSQTPVCAPRTTQSKNTWWTWLNERTGRGSPLTWPMGAFKSQVPGDYIPMEILVSCDLRGQAGTVFYLGYGTSANDMLGSSRMREIYRVPWVP